jgi:hypothetical protein
VSGRPSHAATVASGAVDHKSKATVEEYNDDEEEEDEEEEEEEEEETGEGDGVEAHDHLSHDGDAPVRGAAAAVAPRRDALLASSHGAASLDDEEEEEEVEDSRSHAPRRAVASATKPQSDEDDELCSVARAGTGQPSLKKASAFSGRPTQQRAQQHQQQQPPQTQTHQMSQPTKMLRQRQPAPAHAAAFESGRPHAQAMGVSAAVAMSGGPASVGAAQAPVHFQGGNGPKTGPSPFYPPGGATFLPSPGGCTCGRGCAPNCGCLAVVIVESGRGRGYGGRNDGCCGGGGENNGGGCCGGNDNGRNGNNGCCGGSGGGGDGNNGCCGGRYGGRNGYGSGGGGWGRNSNCCRSSCCRITTDIIFGLVFILGFALILMPFQLHRKAWNAIYATLPFGEAMSAHFAAGPWVSLLVGWALIFLSLAALDAASCIFRFVDCCCSSVYRRRRVCVVTPNCGGCNSCDGGAGAGVGLATSNGFGAGGKTFGYGADGSVGVAGANRNGFLPGSGWWFGRQPLVIDGVQVLFAYVVVALEATLEGVVQNSYIELSVPSVFYPDKVLLGGALWYIFYRLLLTAQTRMNFQVILVLDALLVTIAMHIRYAIFLNYYTNTYQLLVLVAHFLALWLSAFVLCWFFGISRLERTSLAIGNKIGKC